jgi:hypothetical protein
LSEADSSTGSYDDVRTRRAIGGEYVFWGAQYPTRSGLAYNPDSNTWRETATGGIGSASQDGAAVLQGKVLALIAPAPAVLGVGSWAPTDFDGTVPP